jgi:hypothetical protein
MQDPAMLKCKEFLLKLFSWIITSMIEKQSDGLFKKSRKNNLAASFDT